LRSPAGIRTTHGTLFGAGQTLTYASQPLLVADCSMARDPLQPGIQTVFPYHRVQDFLFDA
jgi:hypothetical protein